MSKIPVKFRVLELVFQHEGISSKEILEILKEEYPHDRQVNPKGIENYLLSLKAVGMIELTKLILSDENQLVEFYKITDYGLSRLKYIH